VIVVAMAVDFWISRLLARTARESGGSQALEADALHFATDVWSNTAVILGLIAVRLGFPIADPIAAFVVAILVAVTAINLVRETLGVLTDRAPDEQTVRRIHDTIAAMPEAVDYHTLRARMVGQRIFLDVCVELDPDLTFAQAHDLSHTLQDRLRDALPEIADAVIHVEPAGHPEHQDDEHHAHGYDALGVRGAGGGPGDRDGGELTHGPS
jgi:cation diffusion facilitator family transporter